MKRRRTRRQGPADTTLAAAVAALAAVALLLVAARALGHDEPAAPQPLMRCDPLEDAPGSLLCYDPNAADYGG